MTSNNDYIQCPVCKNPFAKTSLVHRIEFPADVEHISALVEGKLNVRDCPLCGSNVAFLDNVVIFNEQPKSILILYPADPDMIKETLSSLKVQGYDLRVVSDYSQLRQAIFPWIQAHFAPKLMMFLNDELESMNREQQITVCTPLFIRMFKSLIDGFLPFHMQTADEHSPEEKQRFLSKLFVAIVGEQIQRIGKEAARTQTILELPDQINRHIPSACLTHEVLELTANSCYSYHEMVSRLFEHPLDFGIGFRQEFLNATVHAHAHQPNPRGQWMARYICAVWTINETENMGTEPQMLLTKQIVKNIVSYGDLYNACLIEFSLADPDNTEVFKQGLEKLAGFMDHYGFVRELEDTMRGGIIHVDTDGLSEHRSQFLDVLVEILFDQAKLNSSNSESWSFGYLTGSLMSQVMQSIPQSDAVKFARGVLEKVMEAGDIVAKASVSAHVVETLHKFRAFGEVGEFVMHTLDVIQRDQASPGDILKPYQFIHCLNEIGNAFRYLHELDQAIKVYEMALKILTVAPDMTEKAKLDTDQVIRRNLAIVYRDRGDFVKSIEILKQEIEKYPDDYLLYETTSVAYNRLGDYTKSLNYLEKALELSDHLVNPIQKAPNLAKYAYIRNFLGQPGAFSELITAINLLPVEALGLRLEFAFMAMEFEPETPLEAEFMTKLEDQLREFLFSDEADETHIFGCLVQLGNRYLKKGQPNRAYEIFTPYVSWLNEDARFRPYQLDFLIGWTLYDLGHHQLCVPYLTHAIATFDRLVPTDLDSQFAHLWIQKYEDFSARISTMWMYLTLQGFIPCGQLVDLYEVLNGREITARITAEPSSTTAEKITERLEYISRNIEIVFFIDTPEKVYVARLTSKGEVLLIDGLVFFSQDLAQIKIQTAKAFKRANPSKLSVLDRKLDDWFKVADQISTKLIQDLPKGTLLVFLPGQKFTGFPLHLMRIGNHRHLIEDYPVMYSPNFSVLMRQLTISEKQSEKVALISVTKFADTEEFKATGQHAADTIWSLLPEEHKHLRLNELEASHDRVLQAFSEVTEIIVQCHGTTAGSTQGYGICVANHQQLPPAILSVDEQSDHADFIITWEDILVSPRIFVSVACSSGITEIGKAGVRIGLEQTLFSSGTQIIISPLWDVEQEASLTWLEVFYQNRYNNPEMELTNLYQKTCLEVKQRYPHYYQWGAFILNGSIKEI